MTGIHAYHGQKQARGNDGIEEGISTATGGSAQNSFSRLSERIHERVTNEYVLNVAFYSFVGFLLLEAVFAIIAGSNSMLEDAEAMSVDALTYLFNLWAERVKHRPYSAEELQLSPEVRDYRREMQRLYVELFPPFISVFTLIVVTVVSVQDAIEDLFYSSEDESEEDVNVVVMLLFSGANLILDIVNVTCFARAHQAFGLPNLTTHDPVGGIRHHGAGETQRLLGDGSDDGTSDSVLAPDPIDDDAFFNLNMCSAWTHVCADTLRSTSVLIAAMIAYLFSDVVSGALADSLAVIVVSVIILVSLLPLLRGLYLTTKKIIIMRERNPEKAGINDK